jgi:hypothetical protein
LSNIIIHPTGIHKLVQIEIQELQHQKAEAILIGKDGEALEHFPLLEGLNAVSLFHYAAGVYSLRIEAGQEVLVKKIDL